MSLTHPDGKIGISASAALADTSTVALAAGLPRTSTLNPAARAAASHLAGRSMSPVIFTGATRLIEFTTLLAVGLAIYLLYVVPTQGFDPAYSIPLIGGALGAVFVIQAVDGYTVGVLRGGFMRIGRVLLAWSAIFSFFAIAAFLAKAGDTYSRVWVTTWYVAVLFTLTGVRVGVAATARRWTDSGLLERRAIIVGGGQPAEELINALAREPSNDIRICGIFDDRKDDRSPKTVAGYPKLGTIAELVDFGRIAHVDLLIVSLPITAENRLLQFLKQLWVLPVDIRLSAHMSKLHFRPRTYSFVGKVPFLDVADKPIADWDFVAKTVFDRVIGGMILLLAAPVMAAVALAVRLDSPGPVLFKQKRYGFNNE